MNGYLNTWWTAFDTYGVDLILNGHDHMYERSKPINYTVSPNAPVAEYGSGRGQGRCEIVCGAAGAPLYTGTPKWYTETYRSAYHLCKIDVSDGILTDSTFSISGGLIETFSLEKYITGTDKKNRPVNGLSCVPNPTSGSFTVHYSSPVNGDALITVTDMNGKTVIRKNAQKTMLDMEYNIDLGKYARGTYVVRVVLGNAKASAILELK